MIVEKLMHSRGESGEILLSVNRPGPTVTCNFGGGKATTKPEPPPVPSRDQAADSAKLDMSGKRRRGYQSTILGGRRDANAELASEARKTLLGS